VYGLEGALSSCTCVDLTLGSIRKALRTESEGRSSSGSQNG